MTDREELAFFVVQEAELHLAHVAICGIGHDMQARAQRVVSGSKREARLAQRHQVAGQVAAVHGADVRRIQHVQVGEAVPVVEMSAIPAHGGQRRERAFQSPGHVRGGDQPEVVCADGREQLQPDVRGRRAHRDHGLGISLEVVRRQPVRVLRDEPVEELPMQRRVAQGMRTLLEAEISAPRLRRTAQRRHDAWRTQPARTKQSNGEAGQLQLA